MENKWGQVRRGGVVVVRVVGWVPVDQVEDGWEMLMD